MKASQTETVIMLTCCALQSACYSPTGIVISFILAQFQGEVQTNLTARTRKKCAFHRARRFRMPAAIGLRHPASASCLGRHLRLAGRCPNNSSLLPPLAAVVVVALWAFSAENHLIFRVSGKSADFPETHFHRRGRRGKRQSQRRFLRKRGVAGKCCWSAPSQSKPNGFASSPKGRAKSTARNFLITTNPLAINFPAWLSLRESWRGSA